MKQQSASKIVQEMRIKLLQAKKQVRNRSELLDQLRNTLFQELILSKEQALLLSQSAGRKGAGDASLEENIKEVSEIISCLGEGDAVFSVSSA